MNLFAIKYEYGILSMDDYYEALLSPVKARMFVHQMYSEIDEDEFDELQKKACTNLLSEISYIYRFGNGVKNIPDKIQLEIIKLIHKRYETLPDNIISQIAINKFNNLRNMKKACL